MNGTASLKESALVSFTARNVRCYRDPVTLSMQATRLANKEVVRELRTGAVEPERILPCAGIFGANASGKSAILKAFLDMQDLVLNSFRKGNPDSGINRQPFKFDSSPSDSSGFDVELILDGVLWKYGFEVNDERVLTEYAQHYPLGRRALVFERDEESILFGGKFKHFEKLLRPLLRRNVLLLSFIGALENPEFGNLFNWWRKNGWLFDNLAHRKSGQNFTAALAMEEEKKANILNLLRAADLGITNFKVVEPDQEDQSDIEYGMELIHTSDAQEINFELDDESIGTRAWLGLIGPVLHVLELGSLMLVDELDSSLHPHLVVKLIELFQNPSINSHCAQIIFNSHDATILDNTEPMALGRDQVWFSEKHKDGASRLTALAEYRGRRDEAIGRRYLRGRYGGVPRLNAGNFSRISRESKLRRPRSSSQANR